MYKSIITEPIGLYGWNELEPVLLAALVTKKPMLLIGKHGSAKSFVLERLAELLNMNFRAYNASLLNYDDLLGIPIPNENKTKLTYISNATSIWDANTVFIDEINRTKPDLQNKLFPIIYEKRVQGYNLDKLVYRWSAMNPNDEEDDSYIGTNHLDPALADRFNYLINVPGFDDISEKDKKNILNETYKGKTNMEVDLNKLIEETSKVYQQIKKPMYDRVSRYILELSEMINKTIGYISIRRINILLDNFFAIHAARTVLNRYQEIKEDILFSDTAYIHILTSLPVIANKSIDRNKLITICKETLSLLEMNDGIIKGLLKNKNPTDKLIYIINNQEQIDGDYLNESITCSLKELDDSSKKTMSLALYLTTRENINIKPITMEVISNEIIDIFEPKEKIVKGYNGTKDAFDKVKSICSIINGKKLNDEIYLTNLLNVIDFSTVNDVDKTYKYITYVWKGINRWN